MHVWTYTRAFVIPLDYSMVLMFLSSLIPFGNAEEARGDAKNDPSEGGGAPLVTLKKHRIANRAVWPLAPLACDRSSLLLPGLRLPRCGLNGTIAVGCHPQPR